MNGSLAVSGIEAIECAWDQTDYACATAVLVNVEDAGNATRLVVAIDTDSLAVPIAASVDLPANAIGEHRVELPNARSSSCMPGLGLAHAVSARLESAPGVLLAETSRWNLEVEVTCN